MARQSTKQGQGRKQSMEQSAEATIALAEAAAPKVEHSNPTLNTAAKESDSSSDTDSIPKNRDQRKRAPQSHQKGKNKKPRRESKHKVDAAHHIYDNEHEENIDRDNDDRNFCKDDSERVADQKKNDLTTSGSSPLDKVNSPELDLHFKLTTVEGQLEENPNLTISQAKQAAKREYNRRNAARGRLRSKHQFSTLQEKAARLNHLAEKLSQDNAKLLTELKILRSKRKQRFVNAPDEGSVSPITQTSEITLSQPAPPAVDSTAATNNETLRVINLLLQSRSQGGNVPALQQQSQPDPATSELQALLARLGSSSTSQAQNLPPQVPVPVIAPPTTNTEVPATSTINNLLEALCQAQRRQQEQKMLEQQRQQQQQQQSIGSSNLLAQLLRETQDSRSNANQPVAPVASAPATRVSQTTDLGIGDLLALLQSGSLQRPSHG